MSKEEKLFIPKNIKLRWELFKGYGTTELIYTLITILISLPVMFILYKIKGLVVTIISMFFIIALCVMLLSKDENNLCIYSQIKFLIKKMKMQKRYIYSFSGGDKYKKKEQNKIK